MARGVLEYPEAPESPLESILGDGGGTRQKLKWGRGIGRGLRRRILPLLGGLCRQSRGHMESHQFRETDPSIMASVVDRLLPLSAESLRMLFPDTLRHRSASTATKIEMDGIAHL